MNKGRECPFGANVQTHFDEALAAGGRISGCFRDSGETRST